jgi:hypothetical protein
MFPACCELIFESLAGISLGKYWKPGQNGAIWLDHHLDLPAVTSLVETQNQKVPASGCKFA